MVQNPLALKRSLPLRFCFWLLCLNSFALETQAQPCLDAPFIHQRQIFFTHYPQSLFESHFQYARVEKEEQEILFKNSLLPKSYLYSEQEFQRIRVTRLVDLEKNAHLGHDVEESQWHRAENGEYQLVTDNTKKLSSPVNFQPQRIAERFDGLKVKPLNQDYATQTFLQREALNHLWLFNEKNGFGTVDDQGIFHVTRPCVPKRIEIKALPAIIIQGFLEDGTLTGYNTHNCQQPYTRNELAGMLGEEKRGSIIKALRIVEDFHFDPLNGIFTSTIISIGLVGEDREPGKELVWTYFPEMRYILHDKGTLYRGEYFNYEYLLDQQKFLGEFELLTPLGSHRPNSDDQWVVSLEPLMTLSIWDEHKGEGVEPGKKGIAYLNSGALPGGSVRYSKGKITGSFTLYYPKRKVRAEGNMLDGLPEREFSFYYPNGKLKAKRNYKNGQLEGKQMNYWPNGKTAADYSIENNFVTQVTRWYEDGTQMESGKLAFGLPIGPWTYHLKTPEAVWEIMKKYQLEDRLPGNQGNGDYIMKVNYSHERKPDCPPPGICVMPELEE